LGKWRRQVTIPQVQHCVDNKITDPDMTRLPKTQSEGNIPHIALTTGGGGNPGCLRPKVGVARGGFGGVTDGPQRGGHVIKGEAGSGPANAGDAQSFWTDLATMKNYDMIILSCECDEALAHKPPAAFDAMTQYLAAGGRIFTTDYMYTWYKDSPDPGLSS